MRNIYINIEVHQPVRLRTFRFFEIGNNHYYYDDYVNQYYINKISEESYLPAIKLLSDLAGKYGEIIKINFQFSGTVLDQFELYAPEVIERFRTLINLNSVGLLSGTYSNSFGPVTDTSDYRQQTALQNKRLIGLFGKEPLDFPGYFQNCTGAPYANAIIYEQEYDNSVRLFIPYNIFSNWQEMNMIMLKFFRSFRPDISSGSDFPFIPPAETGFHEQFFSLVNLSNTGTDKNLELFYSSCNEMQIDAMGKLNSVRRKIKKSDDAELIKDWLFLQSCDHFYYMNPDLYEENNYRLSFIPYDSAYFAYINYMNILADFSERLKSLNISDIKVNKPALQKWRKVLEKSPVLNLLE
jgi:hypothetical protein